MSDSSLIEYHGALVRVVFTPGRATMRFLESFEPDLKQDDPVMVLTFAEPAFGEAELPEFLGDDVHLVIGPQRVDVAELYGDRTAALAAKEVSVARSVYDIEDLKMFLRRSAEQAKRNWRDLRQARHTINEGTNLIVELLRRAEIKSAASDALGEKQAAAVAVLKRLLVHFKARD